MWARPSFKGFGHSAECCCCLRAFVLHSTFEQGLRELVALLEYCKKMFNLPAREQNMRDELVFCQSTTKNKEKDAGVAIFSVQFHQFTGENSEV